MFRFLEKQMFYHLILFGATLFTFTQQQCLDYDAGDPFPDLPDSYCRPIIQWPVSSETFAISVDHDLTALTNYQKLYNDYFLQEKVTINCLGVAKTFFCADAYPTCIKNQTEPNWHSVDVICDWMCDLFSVRCGENNQFFQNICMVDGKRASSTCSFGTALILSTVLLVILALF